MSRIKTQLLSFYTKWLIKRRHADHTNVGFNQAETIGILYSGNSSKKQEAVHQLVTQLTQQGKEVKILRYVPDPKQVTNWTTPTITLRDISLIGGISLLQAKAFVDIPFDYLYNTDLEGHSVTDYLLASAKAKCRIGLYKPSRAGLFEIMVSLAKNPADGDITSLIAQMLHYTQLLKTK